MILFENEKSCLIYHIFDILWILYCLIVFLLNKCDKLNIMFVISKCFLHKYITSLRK